ncbi:potassium channel family protein [Caminibacter pacificus]|uniref:Trk K+ transport system NAD-binding subunit n=1 Tax=Caminibacter pacificus TaxID=1424653 RepID=A0AAJ4REF0_9BACT|nr:NAD-binding protein [Caminibacter pacificus]NPA87296.1 TrkA family potassium uptake protein [Campylobacterota bacterium]QCI28089.1 TrkA family potassium uptake protein [Caminibacter pacificus]ROR41203.1 Trk K+ transport system NAD-binding subunit [Caminibacter pacificus]
MRVLLFGFDDFGEKVASYIEKKNLEIIVFDEKEYEKAKDKLYDVRFYHSIDDAVEELEDFDVVLAVLRDEDKNLFLCLSLKDKFPNKKLIAKVSNKDNDYKYKLAGVDKTINPYEVTANRIMTILKKPLTLKVIEEIIFEDNHLAFAEVEIPKGSFLDGKYIKDIYKEISSNYNILIIAIVDKEMSENVQFITRGVNHKIDAGDVLIVVGDMEEIERFKEDLDLLRIANG